MSYVCKKIDPRLELLMPGGKVVVDLGCGAGEFLDQLSQTYEIAVGVDMSIVRLEKRNKPRNGWHFVLADLNKQLPIENDYADLVISNQVIEHVTDPFLFSNEIYRILRSGGRAIVTTPNIRYIKHIFELVFSGYGLRTASQDTTDGPWDNGHIHYFTHQDLHKIFGPVNYSRISSCALVSLDGKLKLLRYLFDRFSNNYFVKEFLSGNILLVAKK